MARSIIIGRPVNSVAEALKVIDMDSAA